MSVQRNDVVLVGQKFDYKKYKALGQANADIFYQSYIEGMYNFNKYTVTADPTNIKLTCFFDGMNGEYIFFGYILAISKADDWEGLSLVTIDLAELAEVFTTVTKLLASSGIREELKETETNVCLHAFSHFT
jgi:hypothetical protein